jgi:hypothetical protein
MDLFVIMFVFATVIVVPVTVNVLSTYLIRFFDNIKHKKNNRKPNER